MIHSGETMEPVHWEAPGRGNRENANRPVSATALPRLRSSLSRCEGILLTPSYFSPQSSSYRNVSPGAGAESLSFSGSFVKNDLMQRTRKTNKGIQ